MRKINFLGFEKSDFIVSKNNDKFFYERKDIIDSQGIILAKNITVYDLVLRKSKVKNIQSILLKAKINFSDIDTENLKLENEDKSIVILKKNLSPADYNKVIGLGEPALELSKREIRIYPHKNLFSHILGKVDIDNRGISGMEMYLDDKLKDKSDLNIPVQTSLDANIQFLVYEELLKAVGDFSALGAAAILMDANTGKIISMVSLPDTDNNKRDTKESKNYLSKATKGLYELGSVFKTFTIASAIENKIVTKDTLFENLRQRVMCGKYPINEYRWDKSKKILPLKIYW